MNSEFIDKIDDQWKISLKTAIRSIDQLRKYLSISPSHRHEDLAFSLMLPLNLAERIKEAGPYSPLWKQFIPSDEEKSHPHQQYGHTDPIGDQAHSPVSQIIHRYPKRVLFLPLHQCPVHCRYCFRQHELAASHTLFRSQWEQTYNYLLKHVEIEEIIFSGGDPFLLSDEKIDFYLNQFQKIPHLRYIRFHTRVPVIIPERLTENLKHILLRHQKHFSQLNIVIHTNHRDEFSPFIDQTLSSWIQSGISFLTQSVLLKGINNSLTSLVDLFDHCLELKIRPYYLHHPDQVKGGMHFYLSVEEGKLLYEQLRLHLPGWGIPQYMIDLPGGEGKTWAYQHWPTTTPQFRSPSGKVVEVHFPT
jgi:lysine 2,3-aminomutase